MSWSSSWTLTVLCGGGMEWSIKCGGEFIAWYIPIILWFSVKPIFQKVGLMWAHEKMQAPWSFQLSENCQSVTRRMRKRENSFWHWSGYITSSSVTYWIKAWAKKFQLFVVVLPYCKDDSDWNFLAQSLNACSVLYSDDWLKSETPICVKASLSLLLILLGQCWLTGRPH